MGVHDSSEGSRRRARRGLALPVRREGGLTWPLPRTWGTSTPCSGSPRTRATTRSSAPYRALARECHPDTNGGDPVAEERFKEISFAYEVLRDPERRARYDQFGPASFGGGGAAGQGFGFDVGLGDLFEAFFGSMGGGRTAQRRPQRGADAEVAVCSSRSPRRRSGPKRRSRSACPSTCAACAGTGAAPGTQPVACPDCQGTGEIRRIRQSLLGQVVTAVACGRCQGVGQTIPDPCAECRGEGRRMEERSFVVEVPAGVEDGSTLRLAGRGPAGPRGGPNGSLFVHLGVTPDERFERVGDDVHTTVTVGMAQAALGTEVTVETLEEPRRVSVGPGTQNGHVVRLKGVGVPHLRGRGPRGPLRPRRRRHAHGPHAQAGGPPPPAGGRSGRGARVAGRRPRRGALANPLRLRLARGLDEGGRRRPRSSSTTRARRCSRRTTPTISSGCCGCDPASRWWRATAAATGRRCVVVDGSLEPDGPVEAEPAPDPPLTVAFAPAKGERTEWAVQKLTELGGDRIWSRSSTERCGGALGGRAGRRRPRAAAPGGPGGGGPVAPGLAAPGAPRPDAGRAGTAAGPVAALAVAGRSRPRPVRPRSSRWAPRAGGAPG